MQSGNCKSTWKKTSSVLGYAYFLFYKIASGEIKKHEKVVRLTIRSTITDNQISLASIKMSNDLEKAKKQNNE